MLELKFVRSESYDTEQDVFVDEYDVLQLEHSLLSLSKWESRFNKPFISSDKTGEELVAYIEFMIIDPKNSPVGILEKLNDSHVDEVNKYIAAPMTATTFKEAPGRSRSREGITAEILYYYMIAHNIPFECQTWHLNRLLTLIRVCSIKSAPPKKMTKAQAAQEQRKLNAQRKAQLGTRG